MHQGTVDRGRFEAKTLIVIQAIESWVRYSTITLPLVEAVKLTEVVARGEVPSNTAEVVLCVNVLSVCRLLQTRTIQWSVTRRSGLAIWSIFMWILLSIHQ